MPRRSGGEGPPSSAGGARPSKAGPADGAQPRRRPAVELTSGYENLEDELASDLEQLRQQRPAMAIPSLPPSVKIALIAALVVIIAVYLGRAVGGRMDAARAAANAPARGRFDDDFPTLTEETVSARTTAVQGIQTPFGQQPSWGQPASPAGSMQPDAGMGVVVQPSYQQAPQTTYAQTLQPQPVQPAPLLAPQAPAASAQPVAPDGNEQGGSDPAPVTGGSMQPVDNGGQPAPVAPGPAGQPGVGGGQQSSGSMQPD
jgi:hypothetical protein